MIHLNEFLKRGLKQQILKQIFGLEVFIIDPFNSRLKTHKLSGKLKDLWSFSIDQDLRVVFYFTKDKPKKAVFVDIGNHDEVY